MSRCGPGLQLRPLSPSLRRSGISPGNSKIALRFRSKRCKEPSRLVGELQRSARLVPGSAHPEIWDYGMYKQAGLTTPVGLRPPCRARGWNPINYRRGAAITISISISDGVLALLGTKACRAFPAIVGFNRELVPQLRKQPRFLPTIRP